jgi:Flp pilus assembly protein TadD
MEYTFGRTNELPPALLGATQRVRSFCPRCFVGDAPDPRVADLPAYMTVMSRLYATERFQKHVLPYMIDSSGVEATITKSAYLRATLSTSRIAGRSGAAVGKVDGRAHLIQAYELARVGHIGDAAEEYERGLAEEPGDVDARYNLAVIYASLDREDDAVREAKKVLAFDPRHARARAMLCALRTGECPK